MKSILLAILLLICSQNLLTAQNPLYIQEMNENISDSGLKKILPKEINDFFNADLYASFAFDDFSKSHVVYKNVYFPKSFLNVDRIYECFQDKESEISYFENFDNLKKLFFSNKTFYETAYKLLMPVYKNAFSKMTNDETDDFLSNLEKALKYAENFDLKKEMADEERPDYYFVYEKGKFSAFIYRRIKNKELTKEECVYWLKKIYEDLKSARIIKTGSDDYILIRKLADKYYKARKYYNRDSVAYFTKDDKGFKIVDQNIKVSNYSFKNNYQPFIVTKISNSDYRTDVYGLGDKPNDFISFTSKKEITELISVNNPAGAFVNKMFLIYADSSLELFDTKNNSKTNLGDKIKTNIIYENGFYFINYSDKSSEIISFITGKDFVRKSFQDEYKDFILFPEANEYLLKMVSGESYLLRANNIELIRLPKGYDYQSFSYWKNYIIFSEKRTNKETKNESYAYGVLTKEGKLLLEANYNDIVFPGDEAEIIFMSEISGEPFLFGLYDANFKKLSPYNFTDIKIIKYDLESFEEIINDVVGPDKKDRSIILNAFKENKKGMLTKVNLMLDLKGKAIISEKWPIIERIEIETAQNNLYKVREKYDPENGIVGKWAFFNHKGEQLTKFEFDIIGDFTKGLIPAIKNGKFVFFDMNGKKTEKGSLDNAIRIENSDIYFLEFMDKTCARIDKNTLQLSESVYSLIKDEIVIFNPETYEEFVSTNLEKFDDFNKNYFVNKNEYIGSVNVHQRRILLDYEGRELIDKPTERIYLSDSEHYLYSVREKSNYNNDFARSKGQVGKYALFDYSGKQLTKFIYDSNLDSDGNGNILASRNGKSIVLDKNGKEVK
jgi:hypothetical protein